jgi:hypothetical protein
MKLFLSWSGKLSHTVADALVWWIPQVLHAVKPWISSQDIEKGARWFEEIGESLSTTDFGILCLTASNLVEPWILFEAGALSKSLGQARVCPLLINIKNSDLTGPLTQFNTSGITKDEICKLVEALNNRLSSENKRTDSQLQEALDVWWPRLESRLAEAISTTLSEESNKTVAPKRKVEDLLDEILELSRTSVQQLVRFSATAERAESFSSKNWPRGSVAEFAEELHKPVDLLLEQLLAAGVMKTSPGSPLTDEDKKKLLDHLRASHGVDDQQRRKITIQVKKPLFIKRKLSEN